MLQIGFVFGFVPNRLHLFSATWWLRTAFLHIVWSLPPSVGSVTATGSPAPHAVLNGRRWLWLRGLQSGASPSHCAEGIAVPRFPLTGTLRACLPLSKARDLPEAPFRLLPGGGWFAGHSVAPHKIGRPVSKPGRICHSRESGNPSAHPDVLLHVLEHHVFAVTDNAGANDLVPVHLDPRLLFEKSTTPIVTELVNGR